MRVLLPIALSLGVGLGCSALAKERGACAPLLRGAHGQASLPAPCRALGSLRLGGPAASARALLGPPDAEAPGKDGAKVAGWIFPRTLNRDLAAKPVAGAGLNYGVLYVTTRNDRIVAIRDETSGLAAAFGFGGVRIGDSVAHADAALGPPTSVSRGRDFRSYAPLPLAIHVDEDKQRVDGFEIGDTLADLEGPEARGVPVNDASGHVRHLGLDLSPQP